MMKYYAGISLSLAILLTGCAFGSGNTIGGLKGQETQESDLDFANMDHAQVRDEYRELLDLVDDDFLKEQIERRIAGVSMSGGDQEMAAGTKPSKGYYRDAINSYIDILEKYPNSPDNAEVLYQLSKAYEMEGEPKNAEIMLNRLVTLHPDYKDIAEAHFRLGDINFNNQNYRAAEEHYRFVTTSSADNLKLNAHYMLSWALYKRALFDDALESFAFVLDSVLDEQATRTLTKAEKPLLKDTLHSISLSLVNVGGAKQIPSVKGLQKKSYIWQVYENLGGYYLEKNRYADSAATYQAYIDAFPMDKRAPEFHTRLIAAYEKGAFARDVLLAKQDYVARYGKNTRYWAQADEPLRADITANLQPYLIELASHFHAQAQKQNELAQEKEKSDPDQFKTLSGKTRESYASATGYYGEYLASFPQAGDRAKQRFLKAEAHFEAGQFSQAAADYETVSYDYKDTEYGNRAGYAAIIAYQNRVTELEGKDKAKAAEQEKAVASMLRFTQNYDTDKRSPAVLTNAAEYLFSLNRYDEAIDVANGLITGNKALDSDLKQTAYGIIAHSYYQQKQYVPAAENYDNQRKILGPKHKDYVAVSERMATSVYKHAEELIAAGQKPEAAQQLLRIKSIAPNSKVRVIAQYDAAVILLAEKQWKTAIAELEQLRTLYPQHELAAEFPRKLAYGYEQDGQLKPAAETYEYLYKNDQDAEVKRDALFAAAGLREKLGELKTANEYYKTWARDYEQPFDTRMEARYHVALTYGQMNDEARKLYWLRRIDEGDAEAGAQRTDRSRWLAAWASVEYGDYFAKEFSKRRLTASNLNTALPKKQELMQDAISRYEKAAGYGMLEFTTKSTYKIASLYQEMAGDLRTMKTPAGLSEQDAAMFASLVEQQAAPMIDLAVSVHNSNVEQGWKGFYNEWIEKSFQELAALSPARFNKYEEQKRYGDEIR
ncbi:MAG: cellulose-binding protein [Oceanospirillaceae bacterium]|uniref:tetratricopeptide repeat protein n=1 Tax=unclassified Thalassolituus TaxID=2624967 RepID=UPI000C4B5B15|nr:MULTISPECIES: tetratricopeptide repeat protein [unclassified Thalassolituus]MAS24797.1 cellulose-binding protein [Oceanospirillaceae bacterium]MBL35007.1 cellulose-binding protein [Oceanospirillaceae bacterium]MBS53028.1 cellulose-binding protein [Oceanospirillaceae bacterium]|tara:strand:+ start:280 stop:3111 length:2832 start_codon:yes stop_codon:yes gene_type:complete